MCVWSVCVCAYCVCTHAHTWVWMLYVCVCVSVHAGCLNSLLLFWCYGRLNIGSQACYLNILPLSCIPQSYLLIVDSLTEVGWHLILNLIFLLINDVWQFSHLFECLLLKKCLFNSFSRCWAQLFVLFLLNSS